MSFAVWLTGLPASGKSAIASELVRVLHERGIELSVLESDVMRTQLTPYPRYDRDDRDFFYGSLAALGASLVERGRPVVFDATGNLRRYRDAARVRIDRFAEIYVDTPPEVCKARDPKGLYRSAVALPGVEAAYEPPLAPALTLHGDRGTPRASAQSVVAWLEARGWLKQP